MKKNFRKIMSAFLALIMILSVGTTTTFAAEIDAGREALEENFSMSENARSSSYTTYGTSFSRNVTSDVMYMSGTSISCGMYGVSNTASGSSFTVTLIRVYDDGSTVSYSPREVDGNAGDTTLIWSGITPGNYKFKFAKEDNGFLFFDQAIDQIVYYSA